MKPGGGAFKGRGSVRACTSSALITEGDFELHVVHGEIVIGDGHDFFTREVGGGAGGGAVRCRGLLNSVDDPVVLVESETCWFSNTR